MPVSADLGSALDAYVTELVKSGRYHSKSEVLREGVRMIQEREARMQMLDSAIARNPANADAPQVPPEEESIGDLRKRRFDEDKTG